MRCFLLPVPFFFFSALAAAQAPLHFTPVFRQYTTSDGLPSNEVFAIQQDRQGYMWFGTNHGVCRFNGYAFERFPDTLQSNYTAVFTPAMMEDSCGRMWWVDFQGRVFYHENKRIVSWAHNDTLAKLRSQYHSIGYLVVGGCGEQLWLGLTGKGIFHAAPDGTWEILPRPEGTTDHYWERGERFIHANLLIRNGLAIEPRIFFEPHKKQSPSLPSITGLGSYHYIMKFRDGYTLASIHHPIPRVFLFRQGKLLWQRPYDLDIIWAHHDADGSLLVGHNGGGGLRHYRSLDDFRAGRIAGSYLEGLSVGRIFKDREGGYWLSTQERGVFYCPGLESGIAGGLPGMTEQVCTGAVAAGKRVYMGTRNGKVFELELTANTCRDISPDSMTYLNTLYFDTRADMLITAGLRNSFYKKQQWRQRTYHKNIYFSATRYSATDTAYIWWAAGAHTLALVNLNTLRELFRIPAQRYFSVCISSGGRVWTSTFSGLWELRDGQLQRPTVMHPAFELPAYDMLLLPDSSMAIAIKGYGIAFWRPDSGDPPQFIGSAQGLIFDKISRLYAEPDGTLWACSEQGVSRISPDRSKVENFTVKNGLPSNEVHQVAVSDGYYWFATGGGLFRMKGKLPPAPMPQPIIEDLQVEGIPYRFENGMRLSYQSTNVSVQWVALHFRSNSHIPYRYRLQSGERMSDMVRTSKVDASWTYTLDPRSNFSNLSPGAYRFEVQAQDEEGQWSDTTHWEFTILPPWWQTVWFRFSMLALLGGLGFGVYKYRTGQLKRAFALKQQIFELERSALQAQMNPHFIFNCLNSIQNFIAANDKDRAATFLAQFARLIRQTLEHSFQKEITLEEEVAYLNNYLSLEHLRFRDAFRYEIFVNQSLDTYDTVLPSMLVQPFVENAIVHGMRGRKKEGRIEVRFEPTGNKGLLISVEDNGPEQALAPPNAGGESSKRTSYGVQLARRRLELAMQYPSSTIETIVREGGGTRVEILLK